ncbi:MAG: PstS family phosphate ABC transporter substrate-binding protein, partial [Candidatus Obscuribacterales bacterium]|nr:PstS family phosphate ABC transporter substrate-binding protein [Candidatus Obscuribacterales bacterium]
SRDLTEAEQVEKHNKGLHLKRHMVALDSIAVIVSPTNTLEEITLKQLRQVFSGQIENWSDLVANKNEPIDVLMREKNSGTGRYFSEHVLNRQLTPDDALDKEEFCQESRVMTSNEAMISAVSASDRAIGFVGLNFALSASGKVKLLKVKLLDTSVAVMPTMKNVADDYPLSRPLYLFADVDPKPTVKKFVDFCTADQGQKIARDHGYVTIK